MATEINAKLSELESKHQSIQKRQDIIDKLALDTLFKMEIVMGKIRGLVQNATTEANNSKTFSNLLFAKCNFLCPQHQKLPWNLTRIA